MIAIRAGCAMARMTAASRTCVRSTLDFLTTGSPMRQAYGHAKRPPRRGRRQRIEDRAPAVVRWGPPHCPAGPALFGLGALEIRILLVDARHVDHFGLRPVLGIEAHQVPLVDPGAHVLAHP